ncbi:lipopolysaccharide biosynthesis protein [Candidatus Lokiarchaeum ossiferum]|uniref:lipopolysaccharide biosynthesis protein n=1 Tax=Candidatus Lokiarchaeum ossiferum TaxID=2951803 RepID=UPI00352E2430
MDSKLLFYNFAGNLINFAITSLFFYFSRIWISLEILGEIGLIISRFMIYGFVADIGINITHMKFYSEERDPIIKKQLNGLFLVIKLGLVLILSIILIFEYKSISLNLSSTIEAQILLGSIIFQNLSTIPSTILITQRKIVRNIFSTIISNFIRFFQLLVLFLSTNLTSIYYAQNYLVFSFVSLLSSSFFVGRNVFAKPSFKFLKNYLKYAFPYIFSYISFIIIENYSTILIGRWSTYENVGVFQTATQLMQYFAIIPTIILQVLLPSFSQQNQDQNTKKQISQSILKLQHYISIVFIFIIIASNLLSKLIIVSLFGPEYEESAEILNIILWAKFIEIFSLGIIIDLRASGKNYFSELMTIFYLLLHVILCNIFISPALLNLGPLGASYAILISSVVYWFIFIFISCKKFDYIFYWNLGKIFLVYVVLIGLHLIQRVFGIEFGFFGTIIEFIVISALFFIILFLLRILVPEDITFLITLLDLKDLKNKLFTKK